MFRQPSVRSRGLWTSRTCFAFSAGACSHQARAACIQASTARVCAADSSPFLAAQTMGPATANPARCWQTGAKERPLSALPAAARATSCGQGWRGRCPHMGARHPMTAGPARMAGVHWVSSVTQLHCSRKAGRSGPLRASCCALFRQRHGCRAGSVADTSLCHHCGAVSCCLRMSSA